MKKGDAIIYWQVGQKQKVYFGTVVAVPTEYSITVRSERNPNVPSYKFGKLYKELDLRWGTYFWKPATDIARAIYE